MIEITTEFHPRCPECDEKLEGCGFPLPKKGTGRCPNAGNYDFESTQDNSAPVKDKDGNITKKMAWRVSGESTPHNN